MNINIFLHVDFENIEYPFDYRTIYTSNWSCSNKITTQETNKIIKDVVNKYPDILVVYSDRLYQWDFKKFTSAMYKIHGKEYGEGAFSDMTMSQIEEFLNYYYDKKHKLITVIPMVNVSSGYPIWFFMFKTISS